MNAVDFVEDCRKLSFEKMDEKYGLIFSVSIHELVEQGKVRSGGLESLLKEWNSNPKCGQSIFIDRNGSFFEVFERGDRCEKEGVETYLNIEDAFFDYFDRYLNSLLCLAPDSKINRGYPESEYLKKKRDEKREVLRRTESG